MRGWRLRISNDFSAAVRKWSAASVRTGILYCQRCDALHRVAMGRG